MVCTSRLSPNFFATSSRNAIISRNFQRRVDMQHGKGQRRGIKGLQGEMQQDGRILADRIQQHRALELCRDLAKNMDALGFKPIEMIRIMGVLQSLRAG